MDVASKPIEEFCDKYSPYKVRDFVYKSDYFTPRNVYLINPLYYIYYTYLVFMIVYKSSSEKGIFDFSKKQMKIFYSGLLDIRMNQKDVNENSQYNSSYKLFQKEREKHLGKPALKIDIQDFFNTIKTPELILKLQNIFGSLTVIRELEYFFKYCNLESLPQFHYSIASSILSQFYLTDFDSKIQDLLVREELQLIRYVDDMYIIHNDGIDNRKRNNSILNEISYYLWENSLVLNTAKTKMVNPDEYKSIIELFEPDYGVDDFNPFSSEKLIEDKAMKVVEDGSLNDLVKQLCELEKKDGVDLKKYKVLADEYLSLGGDDVNKVLNNIIYSKKWKKLDTDDMLELVNNWKFILFNPSQFTVLYILVYRYLEEGKVLNDNGSKIKIVLNYLYRNNVFTFRDTLVAVSYLFQSNINNQDLLKKIELVNPKYVDYVKVFIQEFK